MQFDDPFPGSALDTTTNWHDFSSPGGGCTVSSGIATFADSGGSFNFATRKGVDTSPGFDLVAAGSDGIQFIVTGQAHPDAKLGYRGATKGLAFRVFSSNSVNGGDFDGSYSGDAWSGGTQTFSAPVWLKIAINGSNIEMSTSPNGSSWTVRHSVASSGYETGNFFLQLFGDSGSISLDEVMIAGSTSAMPTDENPWSQFSLLLARPMQIPDQITVFA